VERGLPDRTEEWVEPGFAHAESAVTPELVDRIGVWCRTAVRHDVAPAESIDGTDARGSTA
jgi:hypothetical protein